MRIQLRKKLPNEIEFGIIYGGIVVLGLIAVRFLPLAEMMPACVFHGLTGVACPTCGATRSLVSLARGNFSASLDFNPLIAIAAVAAFLYFIANSAVAAFGVRRPRVILSEGEQKTVRMAAILGILANWTYLILKY